MGPFGVGIARAGSLRVSPTVPATIPVAAMASGRSAASRYAIIAPDECPHTYTRPASTAYAFGTVARITSRKARSLFGASGVSASIPCHA